ncbi:HPr family phosphocarrier protein [Abyssisolibacter fermentans]|uniref:HPr family phosphocarrier protein n=1 Tax=Abyssisolibacter fermentans TaxID=1766203 RepID=UPI0008361367|nr:HPr family phosphocarrier protein [Abyssisolibacter fermentans]
MKSANIVVKNKVGLHARPAALFVQRASKFLSDIYIKRDNKEINGKSIMGIMALGVSYGDEITIIASGDDENEAIDTLVDFLNNVDDE